LRLFLRLIERVQDFTVWRWERDAWKGRRCQRCGRLAGSTEWRRLPDGRRVFVCLGCHDRLSADPDGDR
jgi:predicted CXXCH cytochrome family protein